MVNLRTARLFYLIGVALLGGCNSTVASEPIWITRSDGAQSCSPKSGQSIEEGAADLKRAKVRVLDSRKGSDGKMHMQMCGAPSGSTNAYLIQKEDLPQALTLGYQLSRQGAK